MNALYWIGIMVVMLIIEATTVNLVSIWFAAGALITAICALFGVDTTGCVLTFLASSTVLLVIFKKFYKKKFLPKHQSTNADRLIGAKGVVESDIDPVSGKGTVSVSGRLWSAKAEEIIEKDTVIEVCAIEGVKLFVKKV